ncbi:sensor histidine kinase [Clostridium sp. BJN0013]|uniref:sensor histidine kinase n=1 Tax=Clostridium sp. BJN0013 TaxID=3236840 RepID=UPI0034C64F78
MNKFKNEQQLICRWREFIRDMNNEPLFNSIIIKPCAKHSHLHTNNEQSTTCLLSNETLEKKLFENSKLIQCSNPFLKHISLALKKIPHAIFLTDIDGWIISLAGMSQTLNIKEMPICIGRNWCQRDIYMDNTEAKLTKKNSVFIYDIDNCNKAHNCSCINVPIRSNKKIIGYIILITVTDYAYPALFSPVIISANSIETILSSSENKQSDQPLSQINDLIATTVHDLKNPLAVIRGLAQLGKITSDRNKLDVYLDKIINQADELNDIIIELLSIFKPSELFPKKVVPVIEKVVKSFQFECNLKKIKLSLKNNGDNFICMSENLFKRSIQNIIINSIQLMDNGGQIEIETTIEEDYIIITIKDTAGGIPEDIKDSLFQAFTFRREQGTGLGLFMVYHTITNTHKGKIWFNSKPDSGTTFFIKLPIAKNVKNTPLSKHKLI